MNVNSDVDGIYYVMDSLKAVVMNLITRLLISMSTLMSPRSLYTVEKHSPSSNDDKFMGFSLFSSILHGASVKGGQVESLDGYILLSYEDIMT